MTAGLTALDMMVVLSVAVASIFGAIRGFVKEIFSLAAWIGGVVALRVFQPQAADMLVPSVGTDTGASVLAASLVFGLAFIVIKIAGSQLGKATRNSVLGPFDRLLGLGFGAMKGLLAATLAFLLTTLIYDVLHGQEAPRPAWMTKSRTYELMRASSDAMISAVEAERKS